MSSEIYYDRAYIRVGDRFIPVVNHGSSNCFDFDACGREVPEKHWSVLNYTFHGRQLFTEEEIRQIAAIYEAANSDNRDGIRKSRNRSFDVGEFGRWIMNGMKTAHTMEEYRACGNFIADYDGDLPELNACLGEYESIDELNHLACLLSELDKSDLEKFEAAVASGEHTSGVGDLINLVENLDCYDFYIGVSDDETLGRIYAEDMELINIPENLRDYFDYEAYGRDMRINEDGGFVKGGFFLPNGSQFIEYYHGLEDIPDEHKVFAYPQLSIREQMAAYKEVIDRFPQAAERPRPEQSHTDR